MAGWLADKMRVEFENFKILYRLNYSDFYLVYYCYDVIIVLSMYFNCFSQLKLILRCILRRKIFRLAFSPYQSLLLSTIIINDIYIYIYIYILLKNFECKKVLGIDHYDKK